MHVDDGRPSDAPKRPAGHGTGTAAPCSQYDPAGHTLLQLTPYSPAVQGDGELVPAGHARPAGQSTTQLLLRPTSGLNLPVEQGVHDSEAFVMLYWPGLHGLQTDAPPALNDMTHTQGTHHEMYLTVTVARSTQQRQYASLYITCTAFASPHPLS